jgi:hypothetical protein
MIDLLQSGKYFNLSSCVVSLVRQSCISQQRVGQREGHLGAFGSLLCFPGEAPSDQAPTSQVVSMHSVVVWLRAHPEPG